VYVCRTTTGTMTRHLFILILLTLTLPRPAVGQYFDGGHEPPSVRWKVISTDRFDLIFADTLEPVAQQLVHYLDTVLPYLVANRHRPLKRIPILMHHLMSQPNGFVGWAPSRMELYTMPPADGDAHDWLENLVIHENVHWFQFSQMDQGLTGVLTTLFGEHLTAGVMGLYLPWWLIEGDAVWYETAFTEAGRGRDPLIEEQLRVRLTQRRAWSYDKATLRSYRDEIPNHYALGYQLVAYGKQAYGERMWDSVYRYVARNPWNPLAFNTAMRQQTGKGKGRFYREAMRFMATQWRAEDAIAGYDTVSRLLFTPRKWHHYRYPRPFMQGEMVAERSSPGDLTAIVAVDRQGRERVICYPGNTLNTQLFHCSGKLYYTALSVHKRWPNVQFSDIWMYDYFEDTLRQLTNNGRFFTAVADPVIGEIYTMRYHPNHTFDLVKLDIDGTELVAVPLPVGVAPSGSGWWSGGDKMLFVAVTPQGKAIYTWDGTEASPERITPFTHAHLGNPTGYESGILFHAPVDGIAQICWYDPAKEILYRITASRFGAKYPSLDLNGDLLYSEVVARGTAISTLPREDWKMTPIAWSDLNAGFMFADKMPEHPVAGITRTTLCDSCYVVKDYQPARRLFRFHSWAPADIDPDEQTIDYGISVHSQNTLSTSFLRAGIKYNPENRDRNHYLRYTYKGFWPVLSLEGGYNNLQYQSDDTLIDPFRYDIWSASLMLQLPFSSTKRQWNKYSMIEGGIHLMGFVLRSSTPENFIHGDFQYLYGRLYTHTLRKKALRDLYPRWGIVLDGVANAHTGGTVDAGNVMALRITSYWPGVLKNHGIRLYVAGQIRNRGEDLRFTQLIRSPRGWADHPFDTAVTMQLNYTLPLLYPDFPIFALLYVKRIVLTPFFDMMLEPGGQIPGTTYSYGGEITADFHILRWFPPITAGLGLARRSDKELYKYFLFSIRYTI
jgi:hypothetical protein